MNVFKKHETALWLIGAGVTGIGGAVVGVMETPRALTLIAVEKEKKGENLTKWETVKAAWKPYIPAAALEFTSVGCLIGAGCSSARSLARVTTALTFEQARLDKYVMAAKKVVGTEKEKEIRTEVAKEDISKADIRNETMVNTGDGLELFWDPWGARPILSSKDKIRSGLQYVVRELQNGTDAEANLNTFFYGCNIPQTQSGDDYIWRAEEIDLREFTVNFPPHKTPDDRLCYLIEVSYEPRHYLQPRKRYY